MAQEFIPTPAILDEIRKLAEARVNEVDIAKAIGISSSTWWKKKNEYPEIKEAIANAKRSKVDYARGKLWDIIEDATNRNHFQAITFFLKNYDDETKIQPQTGVIPQLPSGFTLSIVKLDDIPIDGDE